MELLKNTAKRHKKRVGRGGKRGTYSGRGIKGQGARAGTRKYRANTEAVKTLPKLRGVTFRSHAPRAVAVNVSALDAFKAGSTVTLSALVKAGILKKGMPAKILGNGDVTRKLTVQGLPVSKAAREKIEKAGGTVS